MHFPKTAGSAIKYAVGKSPHRKSFRLQAHPTGFEHLTIPERRSQIFVTIRKPLDWYLSLYNFKIHSQGGKSYGGMRDSNLTAFMADHVDLLNGPNGIMRWNEPSAFKQHVREIAETLYKSPNRHVVGFCTATFLYYSHEDWRSILNDRDPHGRIASMPLGQGSVNHVIRQELLQIDMDKMCANSSCAIDLSRQVNKMPANNYRDLVDIEARRKIAYLDRSMISRFYGDGTSSFTR